MSFMYIKIENPLNFELFYNVIFLKNLVYSTKMPYLYCYI